MPRRSRLRRFAGMVSGLVLATGLLTGLVGADLVSGSASAAPLDDLKQQATQIEADINANADQLAALNERIKSAQAQLDAANRTITDAQVRIAAAQAETDRLTDLVHDRAAAIYRRASMGGTSGLFAVGDAQELTSREKYASTASARDNALVSQLAVAKADLQTVKAEAQEAKGRVEQEKTQLDARKAEFDAAQGERQRMLGQVQGEIKTLVDQAAAQRRAAEAAAAAQAPKGFDPSKVPPASGRAGIAVSYAQQQLGKPYTYGGSGPNAYDCSGLTQAAWGAAGVGMAHNSESQHSSFPRVGIANVAPGDIVWFPGHVGIYVGGNTVIDAGNESSGVRYSPLSWYQDAVRPG